jgi:hypothetical protein
VSENRVLRRILGPRREEVVGGWKTMHNEEIRKFHGSPDILRVIEYKYEMGEEHNMEEIRNAYKILVKNLKGRDHMVDRE